jgi:hypothetical protein
MAREALGYLVLAIFLVRPGLETGQVLCILTHKCLQLKEGLFRRGGIFPT